MWNLLRVREEKRRRLLGRQSLIKVKARALRQRVWFKTLTRIERCIFDLTVRCVENVRSPVLATALTKIVAKISKILKPSFLDTAMRVGREIAESICETASRWGNRNASSWKHELNFQKFLGVNAINNHV